jgi:hypothetical protein
MLGIRLRTREPDGRVAVRDLNVPAPHHRRIHIAFLHITSDGIVEIASGHRPPGGKLKLVSRRDPRSYAPGGGGTDNQHWLDDLLAVTARHVAAGKEVCVAPAVRHTAAGNKQAVSHTNWLWIDVDGADGLPAARELLRAKPAHLIVESAGRVIEAANERLIYALGYTWEAGRPVPIGRRPGLQGALARHAPNRHRQRQGRRVGPEHAGGLRAAGGGSRVVPRRAPER